MGSKLLKFIGYVFLFVFSFALFLYWSFPYDVVKNRIVGMIEQGLGQSIVVDIKSFKPYWFTGIDIVGLTISEVGTVGNTVLIECKRATARASLFSLIFKRPSVSFDLEMGKGEASGSVQRTEEAYNVDVEFDNFDLSAFKLIAARTGLNLSGKLDGVVNLRIDRQRPMYTSGKISIDFVDMKTATSQLKIGEMELPLPDLAFSKGNSTRLKMSLDKGVVSVDNFTMTGGDIGLTLNGKIFLAAKFDNYRFNLSGAFNPSKKLADALPFLFIVEKEKQSDGSFPLNISGRGTKPSIKVGTFTVPL